jgi:hypothetical protein
MRSTTLALALLLALSLSCKPRSEPPAPTEPSRGTTSTKPKKAGDPCAEIIEAYARTLDKAGLSCRVDGDCACYQGGVGPQAGCGGVANRETVARLDALWQRFRAAGCGYTQHCGPWVCTPRCHQGQCVQSATG